MLLTIWNFRGCFEEVFSKVFQAIIIIAQDFFIQRTRRVPSKKQKTVGIIYLFYKKQTDNSDHFLIIGIIIQFSRQKTMFIRT